MRCHCTIIVFLPVLMAADRKRNVLGFTPPRRLCDRAPALLFSAGNDRETRYLHVHGISSRRRARASLSALSTSFLTSASAGAAGTLLLSTSAGFWFEKTILPNSGILATLSVAAVASNLLGDCVPSYHGLYDFCWSTVLPASLALLLLSLGRATDRKVADSKNVKQNTGSIATAIQRLAVPFAFASMGSVMGCYFAFYFCQRFPSLLLPPLAACQAAACLTASFIGGSVNFFATAALIIGKDSSSGNSLVSAMAAVDIIVMAVYFSILAAALRSKVLLRLFEPENGTPHDEPNDPIKNFESTAILEDLKTNTKSKETKHTRRISAATSVSALAFGLVEIAKRLETRFSSVVPGTACAFLAAVIPVLTQKLPSENGYWKEMKISAGSLSSFAFLMLFAAIGVSADLGAALQTGPACLLFSMTALVIHGVVALGGTVLFHRVRRKTSRLRLSDVLTASNAAIGGPATAAAFCGQVQGINSDEKRGLTVAASVWGVVGYAVGTTVGVALYRFLHAKFAL